MYVHYLMQKHLRCKKTWPSTVESCLEMNTWRDWQQKDLLSKCGQGLAYWIHKCDWICENRPYWHNNWNPFYGLTLKLHSILSRHTKHMGIDSQICFHRGIFSSLSNHERAPQGLWSHWMALIRMCVVSNCSQLLSRPVLWIVAVCATYWTHTTAVCVLMVALTHLRLPTHPLIRAICDITVTVKKVAQNSAVLAS